MIDSREVQEVDMAGLNESYDVGSEGRVQDGVQRLWLGHLGVNVPFFLLYG